MVSILKWIHIIMVLSRYFNVKLTELSWPNLYILKFIKALTMFGFSNGGVPNNLSSVIQDPGYTKLLNS